MDSLSASEWSVSAESYPHTGTLQDQVIFCLRYAILAPSSQNSQPWKFRVSDGLVEILLDRSRLLPVIDPDQRQATMSCGAAALNLTVALKRFSHLFELEVLPEGVPDRLATVRVEPAVSAPPSDAARALFDAITARRTNRQPFSETPVSYEIADQFRAAASEDAVTFGRLLPEQKTSAAALIAEGDRLQLGDKEFRRELSEWTATTDKRRDGIPGLKKGFGEVTKHVAPLIVRTFDRGDKIAAQEHELATHSPVLAVFATEDDTPQAWFRCGMALERVLLIAASKGISASYLNQPLEVAALRPKFAEIIGSHLYPQLIVRMGFGPPVEPTPRRPLEETLAPK